MLFKSGYKLIKLFHYYNNKKKHSIVQHVVLLDKLQFYQVTLVWNTKTIMSPFAHAQERLQVFLHDSFINLIWQNLTNPGQLGFASVHDSAKGMKWQQIVGHIGWKIILDLFCR